MQHLYVFLIFSAELSGEVRRAGSREPISGASVTLGGVEVETDALGRFNFGTLIAGDVTLVVDEVAHERATERLTLKDGARTEVTVYLRPRHGQAFETVVVGARDRTQVSRVTLSRPEITRAPGTFGDPLRAAQNLPGISRAPLFLGTLNMRGTLARDSQVMLEGMPMPTLYHFAAGPSVLPEMLVEDLTLIPGAFGAQYGRSTAGVADVRLREPSFERVRGKASVDLLAASAFVEIPLPAKTSLSLGFRRSYLDALAAPILNGLNAASALPQFTDYQARFVHDAEQAGRVDVLFFGSFDNLTFFGDGAARAASPQWTFQALQPSWTLKRGAVSNRLALLGVYADNRLVIPSVPEMGQEGMSARTMSWQGFVRDDMRVTVNEQLALAFGVDAGILSDRVRSDVPFTPMGSEDPLSELTQLFNTLRRPAQPAHILSSVALHATPHIQLGKFRLSPGLRLELIGFAGQLRVAAQPRFQASWEVHRQVRLLASSGYYEKAPAVETFATQSAADASRTIASWQSAAGVEWQITQALSLTATGYFNYIWRDIVPAFTLPFMSETVVATAGSNVRVDGRVYGGEVFVRHRPFANFFGSLAYSLSRSERHESTGWIVANVDQTHTLTALASYVFPRGWQLGARFRLSSGAPYTSVVAGVWNNTGYDPIYSPTRRDARLPMYHQLDLRLDKTWVFDRWQLTFYLDIMNVYASQLISSAGYSFDKREARPLSVLFPPLPLLGLQGDF